MIAERPHSLLDAVPPELPPELASAPSVQALVHGQRQGQWWWTLLRKVTYAITDTGSLQRSTQQEPIHTAYAKHAPLPDWIVEAAGRAGSMKTVPEPRAFQSGTDVVAVFGHLDIGAMALACAGAFLAVYGAYFLVTFLAARRMIRE